MSLKQSMVDNKDEILNNLPTQELKDEFLANLEKAGDVKKPSVDEQVKEAQAPDHVSEELYDGIKNELESSQEHTPMSEDEQKAAVEEALKQVPRGSEE